MHESRAHWGSSTLLGVLSGCWCECTVAFKTMSDLMEDNMQHSEIDSQSMQQSEDTDSVGGTATVQFQPQPSARLL